MASYAWFAANAERRSHPVGQKKANAFSLHDVHGNIKEWTADCWANDYRSTPKDGSAETRGKCSRRVVRGGSWIHRPPTLRSASREWLPTDTRSDELGMRVARELAQ
jgi:formylglycine-generating enzyme required for sulfatase activity